jgi:hypothetical protein
MGPILFETAALVVRVAIVMTVVFRAITLVYPRIFAPNPRADAEPELVAPAWL